MIIELANVEIFYQILTNVLMNVANINKSSLLLTNINKCYQMLNNVIQC